MSATAEPAESSPGRWSEGPTPPNVRLGENTLLTETTAFKRFHSTLPDALVIGSNCTMHGVHFALGPSAKVSIGDYCYFTAAILLCEAELRFGDYVVVGWNTTIADADFHPLEPAERIADAIACSPLGKHKPRPEVAKRPIIVEDNVWIGPNVAILKGVRIGAGAWIEPGSVVTRDVPAGSRVLGNPAQVAGSVG